MNICCPATAKTWNQVEPSHKQILPISLLHTLCNKYYTSGLLYEVDHCAGRHLEGGHFHGGSLIYNRRGKRGREEFTLRLAVKSKSTIRKMYDMLSNDALMPRLALIYRS
jgi:hypothetical protein